MELIEWVEKSAECNGPGELMRCSEDMDMGCKSGKMRIRC
jgi:hypothetical protein